jgi:uncharacterized protein YybS (DUF2232 family)
LANEQFNSYGSTQSGTLTLLIFVVQVAFFTVLIGASFGQQLLGIGIRSVSGGRIGVIQSILRTLLLALVIPALIWDRDGRGLHDKLTNAAVLRTR